MSQSWAHQPKAIDALRAGFRQGHRRGLLVMPTGGGKTVTAWLMGQGGLALGKRMLFVADRRVLVDQAAKSARKFGLPVGVVMADASPEFINPAAPLQIVSKDSLVAWLDKPTFRLPPADTVVVDECHKSLTGTWEALRKAYPNVWEIGLTATPCRADGMGLGRRYDFLVQPTTYAELQAAGVLVKAVCYAPGADGDSRKARKPTRKTMVGDAVFWWQRYAAGKRTFVFASGVQHSLALRDEFRAAGVTGEHIDAYTPDDERDAILKRLANGETLVVCNCGVLRYGVDVPSVECVQLLDSMGSIVDFRQSTGRALRASDGKDIAVIIDHAGAVLYHGFPDADLPWTLDDATDHVEVQRERMKDGKAKEPVCCPKCYTLFAGVKECPTCSWVPQTQAKAKQTGAGTLVKVDRAANPIMNPHVLQNQWSRCLAIAANKGMKLAAAAAIFHKETGHYPEQANVSPMPGDGDWQRPANEVFPQFCRRKTIA